MDGLMVTAPAGDQGLKSARRRVDRPSKSQRIHNTFPRISTHHKCNGQYRRDRTIAFVFSNTNIAAKSAESLKKSLLKENGLHEVFAKDFIQETLRDEQKSLDKETVRRTLKIVREAKEVWSSRVGPPHQRALADSLQPLFNDLDLYPSKLQVFEMLAIAKQSARRVDLTAAFGEFCFLAAQLRRHHKEVNNTVSSKSGDSGSTLQNHPEVKTVASHQLENGHKATTLHRSQSDIGSHDQESKQHPYEVFLGGSCNPTTWRSDVAIPTLEKMGITYFNPQVANWSKDLIEIENHAKDSARVLFFVLDADTRAAAAAVEAAHLAAAPRPLVLVLQPYRRGQRIGGEIISDQEYLDLSRGQAILQEVAERRNLHVFKELLPALHFTHKLLRGGHNPHATTPSVAPHLRKAHDAFDAADESKIGKLTPMQTMNVLQTYVGVELSLANVENLIQMLISQTMDDLHHQQSDGGPEDSRDPENLEVNFELFCLLVAEVMEEMDLDQTGTMQMSRSRSGQNTSCAHRDERMEKLLRCEAKVALENLSKVDERAMTNASSMMSNDIVEDCGMSDNVVEDCGMSDNVVEECSTEGDIVHSASCDVQHDNTWCAESATKWRHFLRNVHAAISSFVSKIEFNASRSSDDMSSIISSRHNTTTSQSNNNNSNSSSNRKCNTSYSRRREQQDAGNRQKQQSQESETSKENNSGSRGLAKGRKLSVVIPKPMVEVSVSPGSALTPQTTQRLEGLAGSVRDEPLVRDIYLGGSCIVSTSWREDTAIPLLKQHNLTYYKPEMVDYSRIFSAPPRSPANGSKFTFDSVGNRSSSNGLHRQNSGNGTKSQRISKHERSPTTAFDSNQPEKKPKYSINESSAEDHKGGQVIDDVEVRRKDGPYPLHSGNRLSTSDFYKIPDNATPDPFRGMFDERQIQGSRVLLFGVTSDTRCLSPMVLAAHCIGLRPRTVVLCVQELRNVDGLSKRAIEDYNRGRTYLKDVAKQEGVPVFDNIEEATQCAIRKLRSGDY